MKSINARQNRWLLAQTANQNLKQNVHTLNADGMQVLSVLYMTQQ